jgi:hypothetical protein
MQSCVPCPRHPSDIAIHLQPTPAMWRARRRQREVSPAVQTRSSLTSTIMHLASRSRSSSLALYQLHFTEHALFIHTRLYSTKRLNP